MNGSKWALGGTVAAALIAAFASSYSAYASLNATREAASLAAAASVEIEKLRKQNSDRQSDIEMVKLALNILGGEISDKTHQSRQFAVTLLQRYSGVEIDDLSSKAWAETGTVNFTDKELGLSAALMGDPDIVRIKKLSDQIIAAMAAQKVTNLLNKNVSPLESSPRN